MQVIPRYIATPEMLLCKAQGGCAYQATDMESFLKHSMCHCTFSKLKCTFCPNISNFSNASVLRDHYDKHSSEQIFICGSCNTFSSCKKLLSEHARLSHVMEDVVLLEIGRDETSHDPVSNYSISLRDNRKAISSFTNCMFCDMDLSKQSIEEHLIEYHFFKLYYACWKCEKVVSRNSYDLDSHFASLHSGVTKICLNLKSRFDTNDDDFSIKKELLLRKDHPVDVQLVPVTQPAIMSQIQLKEEIIENDDFIDIEDDEAEDQATPVSHIKLVPLNQMLDPRFLN